MIRHIVFWKMASEDAAGKATDFEAVRDALEPLVHLDGIRSLKVLPNTENIDGNSDAVLVGDFDSRAALDAYLVHPEHVAAAAVVRAHTHSRSAVDITLD